MIFTSIVYISLSAAYGQSSENTNLKKAITDYVFVSQNVESALKNYISDYESPNQSIRRNEVRYNYLKPSYLKVRSLQRKTTASKDINGKAIDGQVIKSIDIQTLKDLAQAMGCYKAFDDRNASKATKAAGWVEKTLNSSSDSTIKPIFKRLGDSENILKDELLNDADRINGLLPPSLQYSIGASGFVRSTTAGLINTFIQTNRTIADKKSSGIFICQTKRNENGFVRNNSIFIISDAKSKKIIPFLQVKAIYPSERPKDQYGCELDYVTSYMEPNARPNGSYDTCVAKAQKKLGRPPVAKPKIAPANTHNTAR